MSTYAYAKLSTERDQQPAGESKSNSPPGIGTTVDVLTGIVPAEVLAAHVLVMSSLTAVHGGATTIADRGALAVGFWGLLVLSVVFFAAGHHGRTWIWLDIPRALVAPTAFWAWTMLQPASAFDAVATWSTGMRVVLGVLVAAVLAAITSVLAVKSDRNPPVAGSRPVAVRPAPRGRPSAGTVPLGAED